MLPSHFYIITWTVLNICCGVESSPQKKKKKSRSFSSSILIFIHLYLPRKPKIDTSLITPLGYYRVVVDLPSNYINYLPSCLYPTKHSKRIHPNLHIIYICISQTITLENHTGSSVMWVGIGTVYTSTYCTFVRYLPYQYVGRVDLHVISLSARQCGYN